jgi:hypothetical protein
MEAEKDLRGTWTEEIEPTVARFFWFEGAIYLAKQTHIGIERKGSPKFECPISQGIILR